MSKEINTTEFILRFDDLIIESHTVGTPGNTETEYTNYYLNEDNEYIDDNNFILEDRFIPKNLNDKIIFENLGLKNLENKYHEYKNN